MLKTIMVLDIFLFSSLFMAAIFAACKLYKKNEQIFEMAVPSEGTVIRFEREMLSDGEYLAPIIRYRFKGAEMTAPIGGIEGTRRIGDTVKILVVQDGRAYIPSERWVLKIGTLVAIGFLILGNIKVVEDIIHVSANNTVKNRD